MHRRLALLVAAMLLAAGCAFQPIDDPGVGDHGLTSIVYAADGSVLAEWHAEEDRILVDYASLPRSLIDAVVAIEDERFWIHTGIDLRAIARALLANLEHEEVVQGGSTITQQYLKNVLLTPEVTLERKISEATLALRLERSLTKEQILERYLNTVYFGHGAYGVGTAARTYFGKDVSELTLEESAVLAGLIKAPSALDPFNHPGESLDRRNLVLDKMVAVGVLDEATAAAAKAQPIDLYEAPPTADQQRYAYFTEEVKRRLLDDPRLGETATDRYNSLFRGGLRIYTTIDPAMQDLAEQAVDSVLDGENPAGALVALEPLTGYVRAMVGGRDFYDPVDPQAQFNLATQGRRQPGSSFKPFVLAASLEAGMSLYDVIEGGSSVTIDTPTEQWEVENYDGSTFPDLTVLEATVFSVNVVYARLIDAIGPERVVEAARRAGITSPLVALHSLALGSEEVSVLEMASAYGTFAADGIHVEPTLFTHITTEDGATLVDNAPVVTTAFDPGVAADVTSALTEVVKRGTGQQALIGRPVAGKTGTSQEHRDAWFVGYTPELVAAVWVGMPGSTTPMEPPLTPYAITGGTWPAQIWSRFASAVLSATPFGQLPTADADGMVTVDIDLSTGFLAGPLCPRSEVHRIQLPADQVPTVVCPVHNPRGLVEVGTGTIPDVIGSSLSEAVVALEQAGFDARVDWQEANGLTPETVFGQQPAAGLPAHAGAPVTLTVAGPDPATVTPSLLGASRTDALDLLSRRGMRSVVMIEAEAVAEDAERRAGLVWKQEPAAGEVAGSVVRIWVNPS